MVQQQIDLFSNVMPAFKIDRKVRLIELFAGIGSQAAALKRLGVDMEHWRVVEWDKYAMASYNAVHGTNFETSDIQKIHASDLGIAEREKYIYIMTYSFPCQDLSLAGKGKGMSKGSGTRSGLLWEVERILDECEELPQVLLMENVPQVIGQKNIKDFQAWRSKLEKLGYSNYVQLLNAKDYGIPQSRNRCFMVSLLGEYHYEFPHKIPLKLKLKDMLEDKVDEKYYLSQKTIESFTRWSDRNKVAGNGFNFSPIERERERVARQFSQDRENEETTTTSSREYLTISPAHGWNEGIIKKPDAIQTIDSSIGKWHLLLGEVGGVTIKNNTRQGFDIALPGDSVNLSYPNSETRRGRVGRGVAQTILTEQEQGVIVDED